MSVIIVIPAYKPTAALITVVQQLCAQAPQISCLVVDDGSGSAYHDLFQQLINSQVTVITHTRNQGKGAALKSAFRYIRNQFPSITGIVTADADGQHATEDILMLTSQLMREPNALWLGVRNFDAEKNIPWRSQFGNQLTRKLFHWISGTQLIDTQTGLRGIPILFVEYLLEIKSNGYDFELEMLLNATQQNCKIQQARIQTIYIDHNNQSHFRPIRDSIKIYYVFLRFLAVSLWTSTVGREYRSHIE